MIGMVNPFRKNEGNLQIPPRNRRRQGPEESVDRFMINNHCVPAEECYFRDGRNDAKRQAMEGCAGSQLLNMEGNGMFLAFPQNVLKPERYLLDQLIGYAV